MKRPRTTFHRGALLLWALLAPALWAGTPVQAKNTAKPLVDLGDSRAEVHDRLGAALRAWTTAACPQNPIELRRRGALWLKLVYDADDRLRAAGVFRLAQPEGNKNRAMRPLFLRWPGLVPGTGGHAAYPPPGEWRPLLWSLGAKQWLWLEAREKPSNPARESFLGGAVVNEASGFAAGTRFPHDVAEAVTSASWSSTDWTHAELARPLLDWRRRTPPNAYIETLTTTHDPEPACDALTLAIPDYTDFTWL